VADDVTNLLGLYAGLILLNTLISGFMWWAHRGIMNRDLLVMWACMLLAFIAQGVMSGVAPDHHLLTVLGFSTLWFANVGYARLVTRLLGLDVPFKSSAVVMLVMLACSVGAWLAELPFTAVAMPAAIGVVFPAVVSAGGALWSHWGQLTITGRAMMMSCLAITVHELDYPFFRHLPEYDAMGFTIAIIVVFALSIFAPAVVLEAITRQQATTAAEMDVARQIQLRVLPDARELALVNDLEMQGYMSPADEVGGDYYDVCTTGTTSWLLIGDVTGHGLSSGLVMMMAQSVIASILQTRSDIGPAELTFLANKVLFRNLSRLGDMRSMTIVALRKDPGTQRYTYSGNHDHVYVYRSGTREVEALLVDQVPHDLGFLDEFPQSEYAECSFELGPRDLLLLATDGVTEAAKDGHYSQGMFDAERLKSLMTVMGDRPLIDIRDRLLSDLEAFTAGVYHDDVTFVLARPMGATA